MDNYNSNDSKQNRIKIAFVSKPNPKDKHGWSGTMYKLYHNIESIEDTEIKWIPVKRDPFHKLSYACIKIIASIVGKKDLRI